MKHSYVLLLFSILLAILFFYFYPSMMNLSSMVKDTLDTVLIKEGTTSENAAAASHRSDADIFMYLVDLLVREEIKEELETLAFQEDVMGYLANLALAEGDGESKYPRDIYYRRALDLHPTPAVRSQLAAYLVDHAREEEAVAEYLLLLPEKEALEALTQLGAPVMEISRALVEGNHREKAVEYIQDIFIHQDITPGERTALTIVLGESYAILGRYEKALPYLKKAYEDGERGVSFWYARSLEGTGNIQAASSIYREMGAGGFHRLGNILLQQGEEEEAALILSQSDNPMARWQSAMIWEGLGEPLKAVEIYQDLARGESRYRDDAAYRAYILLQRKERDGTEEMLDILQAYPVWAMRLMGEGSWELEDDPQLHTPDFLTTVERLEELGYAQWAEIELAIQQRRLDATERLALADWYRKRGEYYLATVWGIRSLNEKKTTNGYLFAYPQPFKEIVLEMAEKYHLPPHLIWAVMREESHFRPTIVSPAGALGLMQIMPATGQEIAQRLGVKISPLDLLRPEINIEFGAFYLRQMLNTFDNNVDKALAAYNGGPGNVQRWSRSPLGITPEDFPTAITYFETRGFLSKVLNSYHTYNWIYGDE